MTLRLFQHSFAGVDQDDCEVGGGGACHHVAGVLNVARGIGDYEFAPRSREVAVGNIDGDALLAFGSEAIGKQRQVRVFGTHLNRGPLHSLYLVLEDRFGVVQQATDQCGLAVIDRTGGGEAEHLHQNIPIRSSPLFCGLPWPLRKLCRRLG